MLSSALSSDSRKAGEVYWMAFQFIGNFQVLGD
jgi:hypothetical protein